MPNIGPLELIIVLVVALVVVGPKRLPGMGRSLGAGMREFKQGITGHADTPTQVEDAGEIEPGAAPGDDRHGQAAAPVTTT
jgi:sec-independent protein translocase protein TatA